MHARMRTEQLCNAEGISEEWGMKQLTTVCTVCLAARDPPPPISPLCVYSVGPY
jgi:hypothetical protein